MTLFGREETEITEGRRKQKWCAHAVEVELMMIMIKVMNDEGHSVNISDDTDDNDDVL